MTSFLNASSVIRNYKHFGGDFSCVPSGGNQRQNDKHLQVVCSYYQLPWDQKRCSLWLDCIHRACGWVLKSWIRTFHILNSVVRLNMLDIIEQIFTACAWQIFSFQLYVATVDTAANVHCSVVPVYNSVLGLRRSWETFAFVESEFHNTNSFQCEFNHTLTIFKLTPPSRPNKVGLGFLN